MGGSLGGCRYLGATALLWALTHPKSTVSRAVAGRKPSARTRACFSLLPFHGIRSSLLQLTQATGSRPRAHHSGLLSGGRRRRAQTKALPCLAVLSRPPPLHAQLKPDWAWPRVELVANFLKTMAPLTVVSLSKNTCYLIVQTTAATLPTLCLAAHQASFSLW